MKPCSKNRKPIAWMAVSALEARQEQALRAHLETCEGCRHYLDEISAVAGNLNATEVRSDLQTSKSFHQRVVGALKAEKTGTAWDSWLALLRAIRSRRREGAENLSDPIIRFLMSAATGKWRVALPVIAATGLLVIALSPFVRRHDVRIAAPPPAKAATAPQIKSDLDPTISNYQMVANRSLEKLDELLTTQGNRNPSPTPIYTASSLGRSEVAE